VFLNENLKRNTLETKLKELLTNEHELVVHKEHITAKLTETKKEVEKKVEQKQELDLEVKNLVHV
jgi:hypothetical protein